MRRLAWPTGHHLFFGHVIDLKSCSFAPEKFFGAQRTVMSWVKPAITAR
jgi:hypothetical protein